MLSLRLHRCFFSLCCNVISDVVAIPLVNVGMYALMTEQFVSPPSNSSHLPEGLVGVYEK